MEENAAEAQILQVSEKLTGLGFDVHWSKGERHTLLGAVGAKDVDTRDFELLAGVREVFRISAPYKLASRQFKPEGTRINLGGVEIGGEEVVIMAGPCAVESADQVDLIARLVSRCGAKLLRGGAFKPRTSP